jgi:hypothetical protein
MTSGRRASPARVILQRRAAVSQDAPPCTPRSGKESRGFALAGLRDPPWAQAPAEEEEPALHAPPPLPALQVLRSVRAIMAPAGGAPPGWERDILALVQ